MSAQAKQKKYSLTDFKKLKQSGEKITALTAYDASFAQIFDRAGIEWLLVGDSLGNVIQGQRTTIPVTMDHMVYHSQCVSRVVDSAYIAVDMPFLSYANIDLAMHNAARLMQEGGANMVKLECDISHLPLVDKMVKEGIPVCVHLGLRPQQVEKMGGYRVQGRDDNAAVEMQETAVAFEELGVDFLLLESVPRKLAQQITQQASIPVIGIGAGPECDGQILVMHDALGFTQGHIPSFVHNFYAGDNIHSVSEAVEAYIKAVKQLNFPADKHCFN